MPISQPKQVTRIQLPEAIDFKIGGAFSVAQRDGDGRITVGVPTSSGIATAKLDADTVAASLIAGDISRAHGTFFRTDGATIHIAGVARGDIIAPPTLFAGSHANRASAQLLADSALVLTSTSPTLHFINDGKSAWSIGVREHVL